MNAHVTSRSSLPDVSVLENKAVGRKYLDEVDDMVSVPLAAHPLGRAWVILIPRRCNAQRQ
jgi:hypothetical protein